MKQAFLKFSGKKFAAAVLLSTSILLTSFPGNASFHSSDIEILTGEKTSVQFIGSTNDALVFKIHVSNEKKDFFTLTIKNESGDVLFSKSFNDANFQKQIKVLKDGESDRYYFTLNSGNKSLEQTYSIITSTRTVDDVEINKL